MSLDELAKKGRISELKQELAKLDALVDSELVALKMLLLPSYDAWEYDDKTIELRSQNLVRYIRRAKEIKAKLSELEDG